MPKKRKAGSKTIHRSSESHSLEHSLARNIIELQKINADLAEKFDHLSKEISNLLALFELAARNFAKNAPLGEYEKDKEFLGKIDTLLEQNKTLAKGLTLMEERLRERMYGTEPRYPRTEPTPKEEEFKPSMMAGNRPLPKF